MLSRKKYKMPSNIKKQLEKKLLIKKYYQRPPYQQNDYIGWIIRAKKPETQQKRLQQMLDELKAGDKYMKMKYHAK